MGSSSLESSVAMRISELESSVDGSVTVGTGRSARVTNARNSADSMYQIISDEERYCLTNAFTRCLEELLSAGRSVYLDELGIVFPTTTSTNCSYLMSEKIALRQEKVSTLNFEKCDDFSSLPNDRFPNIAEGREISARLYTLLPLPLQLHRTIDEIKLALRGLIRAMRSEIVTNGSSDRLGKLGTFYALHNRHGSTPEDWFAGADIFLMSPKRWVREAGAASVFERPILQNASELFDAAFGSEQGTWLIDVPHELELLKIDPAMAAELPPELKSLSIKVFRSAHENSNQATVLIYTTDGLRNLALANKRHNAPRCELTFQLALDSEASASGIIPRWPTKAFALAALILAGQIRGKDSAVYESPKPLTETLRAGLQGVLLQRCALFSHEQLFDQGEFSFVNIVAITADEAHISKQFSVGHLVALLKRKGLDQVTKSRRRSVIARSAVSSNPQPPRILTRTQSEASSKTVQ